MRIENLQTSKVKQQTKAQKEQEKIDKELFKGIDTRYKYNFDNMMVFNNREKFKGMKPPDSSTTTTNKGSYTQEPIYTKRTPEVFENYHIIKPAEKVSTSMKPPTGYVKSPPTKGSFKEVSSVSPVQKSSASPIQTIRSAKVSNAPIKQSNKGSFKQETISIPAPISAEPVEEEEFTFITPKKVKSAKTKEEPIYIIHISDDLLKPYIDQMAKMTKDELKDRAKQKYNVNYTEVERQYGDQKVATL